jgi:hypothetical protein
MNSSVSSSESLQPSAVLPPRRRWWARGGGLVAAAIGALLLLVEAAARLWLIPASKDLSRFPGYPPEARALAATPGLHVALIGNSATERGVDPEQLARVLSERLQQPVHAAMFVGDSAEICTWYWMVERIFFAQRIRPDLVVINFFDRNLEDGAPLDIGRLAQTLTGPRDWPELFRLDVPRLDDRIELVFSSFSAAFATRRRIKDRVLTALPGYRTALGRINEVNWEHDRRGRFAPADLPHDALRRFVARARQLGLSICFVAYPKEDAYQVSGEARRIVEEAGMMFLDLRRTPRLDAAAYADNIHLNEIGRPRYTDALARALAGIFRPAPASCH